MIGIDVDIRDHNRESIESSPLSDLITLVEGSSTSRRVIEQVSELISGSRRVSVVLDSNHTHDHVSAELALYSPFVGPGQFLLVADTIVEYVPPQQHRPRSWGQGNNPATALDAFLALNDGFERDGAINDKLLLTYSPGGFLRRKPETKT